LEIYGAQGMNHATGTGGKGGYAYGKISLTSNKSIFICVGGYGGNSGGGYNGAECTFATGWYGGGATHIATTNRGILKNYSSHQSEVIIVAGGGGGAERVDGGDGGGLTGGKGTGYGSTQAPTGGTQDAGGTTYYYQGGSKIEASFGQGAIGYVGEDCGGNGGGGWYGGGAATFIGGGAGGSGHINSSVIINGNVQTGVQSGNGKAQITWMPVL
jgi:hypothetical protein